MKPNKTQNRLVRKRLRSSYTSTLISTALVLFLLSLIGFLVLNQQKITNHIREKIGFTIFLKENVNDANIQLISKTLDADNRIKSTDFVSMDEAKERLAKTLGKDYVDLVQGNPVPPSIEVRLYAEHATPDNFTEIEQNLKKDSRFESMIDSFHYDRLQVEKLNDNIHTISMFLLAFSALLFLISTVLINNTIRLSIYSKRFIINTMQLVGATRGYIRTPFLLQGAFRGVYSAVIALAMLTGLIYFLQTEVKEIVKYLDFELLGVLFLSVILIGMLLSLLATYFAVNKFLNINKDDLYI